MAGGAEATPGAGEEQEGDVMNGHELASNHSYLRGVEPELRLVAYHEAGHAFIAYVLKLPFDSVVVCRGGGGLSSPTRMSTDEEELLRASSEKLIDKCIRRLIVSVAGPLAELRAGNAPREVERGSQCDLVWIAVLMKISGMKNREEAMKRASEAATSLIDKGWHFVEAIAVQLCRRKKLTQEEITAIIQAEEAGEGLTC